MIRSQIREMVALTIGLVEYESIRDTLCNQLINYGNRRVQLDLLKLDYKGINKKAVYSGSVIDAPTDMLAIPNAVVNIKTGIGTRGSASVTLNPNGLNNAVCIFTVIEPTTESVSLVITSGSANACTYSGRTMRVTYDSVGTIATLMAFLNASPVFRGIFLYASSSNGAQVPDLQETVVLTGTGAGWRVAKEVSIEDYDSLKDNEFKRATALSPNYRQVGNVSGTRTFELSPDSITSVLMVYHHRLADMASDTEECPIPAEYEDMLIIDISARCLGVLKTGAEPNKMAMYESRIAGLDHDYQLLVQSKFGDKARLLTDKPND